VAVNGAALTSGLDQSWVVEASAGTGKTTALVNRIVEAIAAGTPVESIVAVTFTPLKELRSCR
jgi:ATP-dependent exoDNAse (exonuclease V) beta subunit